MMHPVSNIMEKSSTAGVFLIYSQKQNTSNMHTLHNCTTEVLNKTVRILNTVGNVIRTTWESFKQHFGKKNYQVQRLIFFSLHQK